MNKPIKTIAVALAAIASMSVQQTEACTRARLQQREYSELDFQVR